MHYLWQILAPGLAVCLSVVGVAGLLAFAGERSRRIALGLAPLQRLALASVCVLALLLNANAWLPGYAVFYTLAVAGLAGLVWAVLRGRGDPLAHAVLWTFAVGWLACALMVGLLDVLFATRHLWMLEGTNHDLVFFYGGAKWAMQHPLAITQAVVDATWGLGQCGDGMQFIGNGCVVQRNGAYSVLGLASMFIPDAGPNQVRSMVGVCVLFPLLGLLPGIGGRFGKGRWWPRGGWLALVLALVCASSTTILLSIINENIGTAIAASMVAMVVLWGLTPMASLPAKWLMLGGVSGCIGIIYGEAAVHACVLVALAVVVTARWKRSWRTFFAGGILAVLACVIVLNRLLPELFASYVQVSGIVAQSSWPSWYIHNRFWWWFAAPFAGLLMTGQPAVNPEALVLGMGLMLITALLAWREGRWRFFIGLLLISGLLVAYVQSQGYQYGEHKLVQMLGPAWSALLVWLLARRGRRRGKLEMVLLVASVLAALSAAYLLRARPIILSHMPSAVSHSMASALRLPQPGDEVVIDTAAVTDAERYVKLDFAIVELHQRGVRVRSAERGQPAVGYSDPLFEGSLAKATSPDWLLVLRQGGADSVTHPGMTPVREDPSFSLYSLRGGQLPVVVSGRGWHPCEAGHCWTAGTFSVETFVPASCKGARLHINLEAFQPPAAGQIEVRVGDVAPVRQLIAAGEEIDVEVGPGRSVVTLEPQWSVTSPQALGISADARSLFASVTGADVRCRIPDAVVE